MTTKKTITTCQSLWDKAYPVIIKETEKHPFLVSMVDGTLEENNFRYYVQQDVLYLKDFIYCLRQLSLKKASTTKDKKLLFDLADGAELVEIALHQSYIKQWNTNGEQEQQQMPNTLLYTSYMRRIIDGSDTTYGEGLAALLPCFWVYMHVGNCMLKLREELDNTNNNDSSNQLLRPKHFNDWIDTYAGDEFENDVNNYIQLVNDELQRIQTTKQTTQNDTTATTAPDDNDDNDKKEVNEELKQIEDHFMMACKLEHMFWDQAITMMEWPATTI